jgi:hypothetical protein
MALLLETCATEMKNFRSITEALPKKLQKAAREAKRLLKRHPLDL